MAIQVTEGKTLEYCQNAVLNTPDVNYFLWQDGQIGNYTTRCTFYETCKEDEKIMPLRPGILYRARKIPQRPTTKMIPQTTARTTAEILPLIIHQ